MTADPAPPGYRHAGVLMMIAGILNLAWGLMWSTALCLSTFNGVLCGPVCCFVPLALVPIGLYEIVTARRILDGERVAGAARIAPFLVVGSAMTLAFTITLCELAAAAILHRPGVKAWLEAGPEA